MILKVYISGFFFVLILFSGCINKYNKITEYDQDGRIKRSYFIDQDSVRQGLKTIYFPNGRIASLAEYTNGIFKDTSYYYYNDKNQTISMKKMFLRNGSIYYEDFHKNGVLKKKGFLDKNDQRFGIWKNYDKDGNHHFTKEYKIIDGIEHTNQMWITLPIGDTLTEGVSIQYHFDKNKLQLTDSIYAFFQTEVSAFNEEDKEKTTVSVVLPKDYTKANFAPDFSNRAKDPEEKEGIPFIEIQSLKEHPNPMAVLQKPIDTTDYKKTVAFYWKPKRAGKDTIRGYFKEEFSYYDPNDEENKNMDRILTILDKKIYFEFPVEVTKD
ncbi:toxin-antitoxin system YwqK family antitoxin [Aquimarina muelleri]|uniref:toxin-antitoxin system YwqK family antitoxin n=1 Tax=Aquimarina muelleri TaxID=279356 RepID=UPI003F682FDD